MSLVECGLWCSAHCECWIVLYLSALGGGNFCWAALLSSEKNSGFTMGRQQSRAQIVYLGKQEEHDHIFGDKHATCAHEDTKSGPNLNGDFSGGHSQVGALLRPAVDQLSTQSNHGLREQRLAIVVQAWRTHHWLLMVHTEMKQWWWFITPTGLEWMKFISTVSLREIKLGECN